MFKNANKSRFKQDTHLNQTRIRCQGLLDTTEDRDDKWLSHAKKIQKILNSYTTFNCILTDTVQQNIQSTGLVIISEDY